MISVLHTCWLRWLQHVMCVHTQVILFAEGCGAAGPHTCSQGSPPPGYSVRLCLHRLVVVHWRLGSVVLPAVPSGQAPGIMLVMCVASMRELTYWPQAPKAALFTTAPSPMSESTF